MKFAKVLQQTLIEEDIPEEWVEAAIQYKVLKKCIGKVVKELEFLGLSKADRKLLLQDSTTSNTVELDDDETQPNNPVVAKYFLAKSRRSNEVIPYLKIAIDERAREQLSHDRFQRLARLIKEKVEKALASDEEGQKIVEVKEQDDELVLSPTTSNTGEEVVQVNENEIVIMLGSDLKFFGTLNSELENLDRITQEEEVRLVQQIDKIADEVLLFTTKKSDLYNWRELFKIYLDSEIFFRYNETSLKSLERGAEQIRANLKTFASRIDQTQVLERMLKKKSLAAYRHFYDLNERLFKILQFQSINTTALRKILKKFDKQTSLNVSARFPALISLDHIFMTGSSIAQTICGIMQTKLLTLVPQIDDYSCPICVGIAYKPIRLLCGHVFCVRCLVKMKHRGKTDCPMCRSSNAIALADSSNLDVEAMQIIKRSFPIEVKEKLKESDKERYKEVVNSKGCVIA